MKKLENKVAIVTGGLSGIGRQIALLLSEQGAAVAVMDMRETSRDDGMTGQDFVDGLPGDGLFQRGDITIPNDVDRVIEATVDRLGDLNIVINNAGVALFKPLDDITIEELEHIMKVNVSGTFITCQRAIRKMKTLGNSGAIVNMSSNFAFVAAPEATLYCASKGAVVTMTKGLALEAAPFGIRVNALCPGATATEFNSSHRAQPDVLADWKSKTPLGFSRPHFLAEAREIAPAALFLASDDSIYMTGASLVIDGGWTAQ